MKRQTTLEAELDSVDRRLLTELRKNARSPLKALAAASGVAASTCAERLRGLVAQGVITRFTVEVDLERLGRAQRAMVGVRVAPHSRDVADGFVNAMLGLEEVVEVLNVSGEDDFLVHVAVGGTSELRDFILDRVAARAEVAAVRTTLVFGRWQRLDVFA